MTNETRWDRAIDRAMEIDGESAATYVGSGQFLIVSASDPDSGAYHVSLDGGCSCTAGSFGKPCWHVATAKLMAGIFDAPSVN